MSKQPNDKDYEVGYGRPPKHSRFKPGQSGNPKGRRKGSKNLDTLFREELESTVSGTNECGNKIVLSKKEVFVKRITNDALKGGHRSTAIILQQIRKQEEQEIKTLASVNEKNADWSTPQTAYEAWKKAQEE